MILLQKAMAILKEKFSENLSLFIGQFHNHRGTFAYTISFCKPCLLEIKRLAMNPRKRKLSPSISDSKPIEAGNNKLIKIESTSDDSNDDTIDEAHIFQIDGLPNEILLKVFGFLPSREIHHKVCFVCKKWFQLIRNDTILSGELTIYPYCEGINRILLKWPKLRVLNIPIYNHSRAVDIKHIHKDSCPCLQKIYVFYRCTTTEDIFKKLGFTKHFPKKIQVADFEARPDFLESFDLREITFIGCSIIRGGHFPIPNIEDKFRKLIRRFPHLKKIAIDNGRFEKSHIDFMKTAQNNPNLVPENYWSGIVEDFLTFFKSGIMKEVMAKCQLEIWLMTVSQNWSDIRENISIDVFKRLSSFLDEKNLLKDFRCSLKMDGVQVEYSPPQITIQAVRWNFVKLGMNDESEARAAQEIAQVLKLYQAPKELLILRFNEKSYEKIVRTLDLSKCERLELDCTLTDCFVNADKINFLLNHCPNLKFLDIKHETEDDFFLKEFLDFMDDVAVKKLKSFFFSIIFRQYRGLSMEIFSEGIKEKFAPKTSVVFEFRVELDSKVTIVKLPFKEPVIRLMKH